MHVNYMDSLVKQSAKTDQGVQVNQYHTWVDIIVSYKPQNEKTCYKTVALQSDQSFHYLSGASVDHMLFREQTLIDDF